MFANLIARIAEGAKAAEDLRNGVVAELETLAVADHGPAVAVPGPAVAVPGPAVAVQEPAVAGQEPADADPDDAEMDVDSPSVPPAGMPWETDFFHSICLDMHVLTGYLQINAANAKTVERVVKDWSSKVVVEGASQAFERELETEISGGKVPRKTKRNTQTVERISRDVVIAMRHEDYTTTTNIRHSNFRNSFTARKVSPEYTNGRAGTPALKGPIVKFFSNGRFQAAGWKTVPACERFIEDVRKRLGLPPVDKARHSISLVNGSARIKAAGDRPIVLRSLRDRLVANGINAVWNPTTGNNGMKVTFVDEVALKESLATHFAPAVKAMTTYASECAASGVVSKMFSQYAKTQTDASAEAVRGLGLQDPESARIAAKAAAMEMKKAADAVSTKDRRKKWERSAMVFANGYVKVFSTGEPQLARLFPVLEDILESVF
jgi:hypothetical protein